MRSKTTGRYLIAALAVLVTLILAFVRGCSVEAVYPVSRLRLGFDNVIWSRVRGFFRASSVAAENVRLQREAAEVAVLRRELSQARSENDELRKLLKFQGKARAEWLAAEVLSRGGCAAGVREVVRLDCGSLAGVVPGAVVVAADGLVGQVTSVTPHTAEVALLSDRQLKVACAVETGDGDRCQAILCGGSSDELQLRYFRGRTEVQPGSRVVTSGRGGIFPRGIEIGKLISIEPEAGTSGYRGRVRPAVTFESLDYVFVRRAK